MRGAGGGYFFPIIGFCPSKRQADAYGRKFFIGGYLTIKVYNNSYIVKINYKNIQIF